MNNKKSTDISHTDMNDAKTDFTKRGATLNTASAVFDSPVIYGVRVETSNPYHLLISKCFIYTA